MPPAKGDPAEVHTPPERVRWDGAKDAPDCRYIVTECYYSALFSEPQHACGFYLMGNAYNWIIVYTCLLFCKRP